MEYYKYSPNEIKMAFAKSFKEIRAYTGLSLLDIERITQINNPSLSRYENGKVEPSISQAIFIANVFELTVEEFITYGLNEKIEGSQSETIIERFNENIANLVFELGDNAIKLFQEIYKKLNIKEIVEEYS